MRRSFAAASSFAVAACFLICLPEQSFASESQPYVIAGLGPETATPALPPRAASPAPASPNYGGGLIQLLMTGSEPGSSGDVLYNHPAARPTPSPASLQQASYAPVAASAQAAINPIYQRQEVAYDGSEKPGTIVVDTTHKFLFLVLSGDRAIRYGVGVGRPGFEWSGVQKITRKAKWPTWTPPAAMRLRIPTLPIRMAGGPDNPLGARALYLGSSLYRIHGTNQPETIGKSMSSGCIRMMNDDVRDLYRRVEVGAKVVVI